MKIVIKPEVYAQIDHYVQNTDIEVSGLGRVKTLDNGTLEVNKIYLLKQENSAATTDLDPEAVADLLYTSRKDAELGNLNFWWHSHVDMQVFWSGTDMDTIKQFGDNGYIVATVFNKSKQMRSAVYAQKTDILPAMFEDDIDTIVGYEPKDSEIASWDKDLKDNVTKKVFKITGAHPNHFGGYQGELPMRGYNNSGYPDYEEHTLGEPLRVSKNITSSDDEQQCTLNMQSYVSYEEESEWNTYYAELKGLDPVNITYVQLWAFYELWDGDFNAMSTHVLNQMAVNDMEMK